MLLQGGEDQKRSGGSVRSHALGAVLGWLTNTACSAVVGLAVGAVVVAVMHVLPFGHGKGKKKADAAH